MKVLIVDGHPIVRVGIRTVLESQEGVGPVWEADNVEEALHLVRDFQPDLAILDLRLKDNDNGTELCREMKSLPVPLAVLVYTACNSAKEVSEALLAGAGSYVYKGLDYVRLLEAIERTCAGDKV